MVTVSPNNSMGLVRYILSLIVFIAHFLLIFEVKLNYSVPSYYAVSGFFALSGFLIYPAFIKSRNTIAYFNRRARRVLPPYFFIVLLCAIGLVIFSSLNPIEYFCNKEWWRYLLSNILFLNFLEPELPGVFQNAPIKAVNGSLWTMKVEICLYVSVPIIVGITSILRRKKIKITHSRTFIFIYLISYLYQLAFHKLYTYTESEIYLILSRQFMGQLMFFYSGVFLYFNYEKILKYRNWLIIISLILLILCIFLPYYELDLLFRPFILSVFILSVSLIPGLFRFFNYNNVSYGIYLFHWPVMQVLRPYLNSYPAYMSFLISFITVFCLAFFSWYVIEKRFLPKKFV